MQEIGSLIIFEEATFFLGELKKLFSDNGEGNCVIFEDNGRNGLFHGFEFNENKRHSDTLFIYKDNAFLDKGIKSTIKILWTEDLSKAFLSINNYCHAVIDFKRKAGYCRSGTPKNENGWALIKNRKLTDEMMINLANE